MAYSQRLKTEKEVKIVSWREIQDLESKLTSKTAKLDRKKRIIRQREKELEEKLVEQEIQPRLVERLKTVLEGIKNSEYVNELIEVEEATGKWYNPAESWISGIYFIRRGVLYRRVFDIIHSDQVINVNPITPEQYCRVSTIEEAERTSETIDSLAREYHIELPDMR